MVVYESKCVCAVCACVFAALLRHTHMYVTMSVCLCYSTHMRLPKNMCHDRNIIVNGNMNRLFNSVFSFLFDLTHSLSLSQSVNTSNNLCVLCLVPI